MLHPQGQADPDKWSYTYLIYNTICVGLCPSFINNFYISHSVHYDSFVTMWPTTIYTPLNLQ